MTAAGRASSRGAGAPDADRAARIGALGLGWIGRHRIAALAGSGAASVVAVADPNEDARVQAARELPGARVVADLDALLELDLDGIVIATPSALHADQTIMALRRGVAVFCEKPLGRDAAETAEVVQAARAADRLLGVDFSYRHTRAAQALRAAVQGGERGLVYAAELTFHNAYGPDKPWFTHRRLAGGGCLIDLGTHLVDLALWVTGARGGEVVAATVRHRGWALPSGGDEVEDFALAELDVDAGVTVRLGCSWFLPAGCDCVFDAPTPSAAPSPTPPT